MAKNKAKIFSDAWSGSGKWDKNDFPGKKPKKFGKTDTGLDMVVVGNPKIQLKKALDLLNPNPKTTPVWVANHSFLLDSVLFEQGSVLPASAVATLETLGKLEVLAYELDTALNQPTTQGTIHTVSLDALTGGAGPEYTHESEAATLVHLTGYKHWRVTSKFLKVGSATPPSMYQQGDILSLKDALHLALGNQLDTYAMPVLLDTQITPAEPTPKELAARAKFIEMESALWA